MSGYFIPRDRQRVETRAGNSRFITTVSPATTAAEARAFIRDVRAEMPDATHHVYAFRVGFGSSVTEGMSDDGEPSGTSGPPTLAVVRGSGLGDIALVTTRYFGGTKLGTGGLVAAYTAAAQAALAALDTVEKIERRTVDLEAPYHAYEPIRRALAARNCVIEDESFGAAVSIRFQVARQAWDALREELLELTDGRAVLQAE